MSAPDTIFVQIAAYRDPELGPTLEDLFRKAARPERISVGVCLQSLQTDPALSLRDCTYAHQVRVDAVDAIDARGVGWARSRAEALLEGEDYVLQIDSHMRFAEGWDTSLLDMLAVCPAAKPVLSTYPPGYEPPATCDTRFAGTRLVAKEFGTDRILRLSGRVFREAPPAPVPGAFLAAGFLFASSRLVKEAPADPLIYFYGEEITLAARLWTGGWDFFHPNRTALYHYYWGPSSKRVHHWSDHKDGFAALRARSNARVLHLLGTDVSTDPEVIQDIGRYGLGSERSLSDYESYSGVRFAKPAISQSAREGHFGSQQNALRPKDDGELPIQRSPRLSVTLIVRNEEIHIERILRVALSFADEIVVVDTGSADRTVELARGLSSVVLEVPWTDDFAAARNVGVDACTGDFLMWLDADDVIDEQCCARLRELLNNGAPDWDVLLLPYQTQRDAAGTVTRSLLRERVVRRSLNPRFKYPVHEVLDYPASARRLTRMDIIVQHDNLKRWQSSPDRNRAILRKAVESDTWRRNIRIWWMLAREEQPEKAVLAFNRLLELLPPAHPASRITIYYFEFAQKLLSAGRDQEALEYLGRAISIYPLWREPFFLAARIHRKFGRHQESRSLLQACRHVVAPVDLTHDPTLYSGYQFWDLLSLACGDSGDYLGALEAVEQALRALPGDERLMRHKRYWLAELDAFDSTGR